MKRKRETTIKDLPPEILNLISKYPKNDLFDEFNPRKDIGPLKRKVNGISHGHDYITDNMLRASEQGPITHVQSNAELVTQYWIKRIKLQNERKLVSAIYGDKHPSVIMINKKLDDLASDYPSEL